MSDSNRSTLIFAAVLGVVCAALLTAAGELTRSARELNVEADWKKNVLAVLDPDYNTDVPAERVLADFRRMIPRGKEPWGKLEVYRYEMDGKLVAMAVPFTGPALWGDVEGYLALEADLTTIRGIAFTKQSETPGLGGDIAEAPFRNGWKRKQARTAAGIVVCKGPTAVADNEVNGITGATKTGDGVQAMVNAVVKEIVAQRARDKEAGHGG